MRSLLIVFIPLVLGDSIINEGLRFRKGNLFSGRRGNSIAEHASPVEYLRTPNFDVIFLNEDSSNPIWMKYANLFQPIDLNNAQTIEVSFKDNAVTAADDFRPLSPRLSHTEVESLLAMLGRKKHIIVLRPRDCKPHSLSAKSLMNEFINEFLHNLLQQLPENTQPMQLVLDPIINRILKVLEEGDAKMIEDLKHKFESEKQIPWRFPQNANPTSRESPGNNDDREDPCNERYLLLLQNQESSPNPNEASELLLRVLKVITKSA